MRTALFLPIALTLAACGGDDAASPIDATADDGPTVDSPVAIDAALAIDGAAIDAPPAAFVLTSTAITEGGVIPVVHSCRGANTSPPLAWTGGPAAPRYELAFTDITTPANPFLPSIIWDIPGTANCLPEGIQRVYMPPVPAPSSRSATTTRPAATSARAPRRADSKPIHAVPPTLHLSATLRYVPPCPCQEEPWILEAA